MATLIAAGIAILVGTSLVVIATSISGPASKPLTRVGPTAALSPSPLATVRPGTPPIAAGSVVRVDIVTGVVRGVVPVGKGPGLLALAGGQLWALDFGDGSVSRIDPRQRTPVATIEFAGSGAAIVADGDELWVAADEHDLVQLDGRSGAELARFHLSDERLFQTGDAGFMTVAGGAIWMTVPNLRIPAEPHELWRIDAATGRVESRQMIDRDPHPPIVFGHALFLVSPTRSTLTRIDTATGHATVVRIGNEPYALTEGDGSIWVGHDMDRDVWRIDPTTLEAIATIDIGAPIRGMAFGAGRVWLTTPTSLIAIDPGTDRIVATTRLLAEPLGRGPAGVAVIGDSIWIGIE